MQETAINRDNIHIYDLSSPYYIQINKGVGVARYKKGTCPWMPGPHSYTRTFMPSPPLIYPNLQTKVCKFL